MKNMQTNESILNKNRSKVQRKYSENLSCRNIFFYDGILCEVKPSGYIYVYENVYKLTDDIISTL